MPGGGGTPGGRRATDLAEGAGTDELAVGKQLTGRRKFHKSVVNFLAAGLQKTRKKKYDIDIQEGVLEIMHRLYQRQDQSDHHMLLQEDDIIPTETSDGASPPEDKYLIRCFKHDVARVIAGVMLFSIFITALTAPLTFIWGATWQKTELVPWGMKVLLTDLLMDLVFLATCLLKLKTSYMDPKYRMEVVDRRKIWRRYTRSAPYLWLLFTTTCHFWTAVGVPMLINVVKLTRVSILFDLPDALIWWRDRRRYRFGRLALLLFASSHCVACLLAWGSGYRETAEELGFDEFETNFNGETISGKKSLYWMALVESVFLLTGGLDNPVGDGSLRERNFGSLVFVTVMGPVGCLIVAVVISLVTREQTLKYALEMHHEEKKAFMKRAMDSLMIPLNLQRRVFSLHYFQRMSHDKLALKELLKSENLSKPLELSLRLFIYRRVVMSGFFDTTHQNYILEVVRVLEDHIYIPGDYVCRRGEMGAEMFFVNQGELGVLVPSVPSGTEGSEEVENAVELPTTKKSGEYFGEIVLIKRIPRTAWVRANGYVVCAVLTRDNVETIWKFFPCEREKVVRSVTTTVNKDRWRAVRNKVNGNGRATMAPARTLARAGTEERGRFASDETGTPSAGAAASDAADSPVAAGGATRFRFDGVADPPDGSGAGASAHKRLSYASVKEAEAAENNEAAAALDAPEEPAPRGLDATCDLILEGQKAIQAQIADLDRRQAALEKLVKSQGAAYAPRADQDDRAEAPASADAEAHEPGDDRGAEHGRKRGSGNKAKRRARVAQDESEALPITPPEMPAEHVMPGTHVELMLG